MAVYTATFTAVSVSAAQDVFEIVAAAGVRTSILQVILGQYTDFGDAAAEIVSVQIIRGYTTSGSNGGTAPTPSKISSITSRAARATVEINNTTVANTGTSQVLYSDVWNLATSYVANSERTFAGLVTPLCILEGGERLVVRITAPADAITMNGTLVFEEPGR